MSKYLVILSAIFLIGLIIFLFKAGYDAMDADFHQYDSQRAERVYDGKYKFDNFVNKESKW